MHHMREMIATQPDVQGNTDDTLIRWIEECYSCAQPALHARTPASLKQ